MFDVLNERHSAIEKNKIIYHNFTFCHWTQITLFCLAMHRSWWNQYEANEVNSSPNNSDLVNSTWSKKRQLILPIPSMGLVQKKHHLPIWIMNGWFLWISCSKIYHTWMLWVVTFFVEIHNKISKYGWRIPGQPVDMVVLSTIHHSLYI